MLDVTVPDYTGGSLVNLVAEFERRLTGSTVSPGLHPDLAALIPEASTYVLVLFDGLGALQLEHPAVASLRAAMVATIDAPFPTTTTVSLATVATGLAPSQHGLLGYQMWLPEIGRAINTIHWTTLGGGPFDYDYAGFLPRPNLAERIAAAGIETITVQPGNFLQTNLTKVLFRGNRFEGIYTIAEWVDATVQLAATPGRFIVAYLPHVDFAAHVGGQGSPEYREALTSVATAWEGLVRRLPATAVAVGTADHGHVDFPPDRQVKLEPADHRDRTFYGDGRAMFVRGDGAELATRLPATWVPCDEMIDWWGPGPRHPAVAGRAPDGVLLTDDGYLLLHKYSDARMVGNHGGLTDAERLIPLMVSGSASDT